MAWCISFNFFMIWAWLFFPILFFFFPPFPSDRIDISLAITALPRPIILKPTQGQNRRLTVICCQNQNYWELLMKIIWENRNSLASHHLHHIFSISQRLPKWCFKRWTQFQSSILGSIFLNTLYCLVDFPQASKMPHLLPATFCNSAGSQILQVLVFNVLAKIFMFVKMALIQ